MTETLTASTNNQEQDYVFEGFNVRHNRYDRLRFLAFSAEEAYATCQRLYPDFRILSYGLAPD